MALINHSCAPNSAAMVLASSTEDQVARHLLSEAVMERDTSRSSQRSRALSPPSPSDPPSPSQNQGKRRGDLMMLVRASKDLQKGQEVTISYAGRFTSSPLEVRRKQLMASYGFECGCDRCVEEEERLRLASQKGRRDGREAEYAVVALRDAYFELLGDEEISGVGREGLKAEVMSAVDQDDIEEVIRLQKQLHSMARR